VEFDLAIGFEEDVLASVDDPLLESLHIAVFVAIQGASINKDTVSLGQLQKSISLRQGLGVGQLADQLGLLGDQVYSASAEES
jgi:hypothetical protein